MIFLCLFFSLVSFATPLFVDDPNQLHLLEAKGMDFARFGLQLPGEVPNNFLLNPNPGYAAIVKSLQDDLHALKEADPRLGTTMATGHRLFNGTWLKSPHATYELVGVVQRLDRAPFQPENCGETRAIYRLAYNTNRTYSRLPFTLNVVYWNRASDCNEITRRWEKFYTDLDLTQLALKPTDLKAIEVNFQNVRWPSTIRPDMGGYAEYFLRVFVPEGKSFRLGVLENTPDVSRLKQNPREKEKLKGWITAHLKELDLGVAKIPDEFLATKATSVALHGVHRLANAPFTSLFEERDFAQLTYDTNKVVRSAHGLIRRLNDLSCMGCHQGRTVAGFHFLGVDRPETDAVNAIAVSASAHFHEDQLRRGHFYDAVKSKKKGEDLRPLSVRAFEEEGELGAHCGQGDESFKAWTCAPGYECRSIVKDTLVSRTGVCEPKIPRAGSSCAPGHIRHQLDLHKDRINLEKQTNCSSNQFCEISTVGFPGGMCSGACHNLKSGEICGSIAVLQGFNDCLTTGKKFADCLNENVRPGALAACSQNVNCRDDYICARTKNGGGCIPPYFLFQLRLDGHPAI